MDRIERINRTLKYKGTILDIYDDEVRLANGNTAHWDFISHGGAAAVVPVIPDGKILMVKQYRNALDRFTLEIPAGKLDAPGEPGDEAAKRELSEETGYEAGEMIPLLILNTTVAFCNEKIWIYVTFIDDRCGEQSLDDDEDIQVKAYSVSELEEMIYSMQITDSKTIAAILAYKNKYVK